MSILSSDSSSSSPTVAIRRVLAFCAAATLATTLIVAGGTVALAFDAWFQALLMLFPLLAMAGMTGLALTYFPARTAEKSGRVLFADSPWPAGFRLILAFALGLGLLGLITLALGSAGLLYSGAIALAYVPTTLLGVFGILQLKRQGLGSPTHQVPRFMWLLALIGIPVGVMLIMASFPPGFVWVSEGNGYDVLEYHLQLPKEYVTAHSTAPVTHNIYSYMPSLMEMLYASLGTVKLRSAGVADFTFAIYASQYLNVFITGLAGLAVLLAPIKLNWFGRIAGCVLILATPWTIVVGTLAYNDGAMLAFGTFALVLALADDFPWRGVLIGVLLGFAVGCKLTAGVMFAVPVGLLLLIRLQWRPLIAAMVLSAIVFAPWAIRSYAATGNPIFPVAMKTLGSGHLSPELRDQFDRGHAPRAHQQSLGGRMVSLFDETVMNDQWSIHLNRLLGSEDRLSLMSYPMRVGLMWPFLMVVLAVGFRQRTIFLLLLMMGVQIAAWMFLTHLQARFLLPMLAPLALIVALSCRTSFSCWFAGIIVAIQLSGALLLPYTEVKLFAGVRSQFEPRPYFMGIIAREPGALALPDMYLDAEKAGTLDQAGKVYLVGLATPLFFNHPVMYNTPFDRNLLAEALASGGPEEGIRFFRDNNVRYVVVSWSEVDRLRRTYGFSDSIARESFERLTRLGLQQIPTRMASVELYEVTR